MLVWECVWRFSGFTAVGFGGIVLMQRVDYLGELVSMASVLTGWFWGVHLLVRAFRASRWWIFVGTLAILPLGLSLSAGAILGNRPHLPDPGLFLVLIVTWGIRAWLLGLAFAKFRSAFVAALVALLVPAVAQDALFGLVFRASAWNTAGTIQNSFMVVGEAYILATLGRALFLGSRTKPLGDLATRIGE
jgi:hypothetical protein